MLHTFLGHFVSGTCRIKYFIEKNNPHRAKENKEAAYCGKVALELMKK